MALTILACGGGSGGGDSTPNPFAGTYTGTYSIPSASNNGTMAVTVTTGGAFTGTIRDVTLSMDGTVSGTLSNSGSLDATVRFTGVADSSVTGSLVLSGNNVTGNLTQRRGSASAGMTVALAR